MSQLAVTMRKQMDLKFDPQNRHKPEGPKCVRSRLNPGPQKPELSIAEAHHGMTPDENKIPCLVAGMWAKYS